ncbi:hypothetical protein Bca52824_003166 [Brassica carinata]|uniref:3-isopropylmalate dehydratase n=1 Tax=Brassica carinata TaxID=52824 RepID=A0A8X7WM62_BRACI|nr:hypothetical protein Bca52824_003166 [Brassica carinata]
MASSVISSSPFVCKSSTKVKTGMTMTEKILAKASEKSQLVPGDNIWVNVDVIMTHDVYGPGAFGIFKREFGDKAKSFDSFGILLCCMVVGCFFTKVRMLCSTWEIVLLTSKLKRKGSYVVFYILKVRMLCSTWEIVPIHVDRLHRILAYQDGNKLRELYFAGVFLLQHTNGRLEETSLFGVGDLKKLLCLFCMLQGLTENNAKPTIMNAPPASPPPPTKRRPGRTSRSAMKPKTHNPKIRKMKKTSETPETEADVAVKAVAGEEELMTELHGAEAELEPCNYYGTCHEGGDCRNNNNNSSIGGDKEVSSFDEDIIKLLLDESDPSHVFTELNHLGDSVQAKGSSEILNQEKLDCLQSGPSMESFLNYEHQVNNAFTDEFIDWDCVWQQGNYNKICDEKESSDSMVSWLLDGDDEATIGKSNCENSGEPLNHLDEENALVAWLLS